MTTGVYGYIPCYTVLIAIVGVHGLSRDMCLDGSKGTIGYLAPRRNDEEGLPIQPY